MIISFNVLGVPLVKQQMETFKQSTIKKIRLAINETGKMMVEDARKNVLVASGLTRDSIKYLISYDGMSLDLGVYGKRADVAQMIEFGTKAHTITARGKALFWVGADHPIKSVNHPGTSANPFLYPAFRRGARYLRTRLADILGR
jgi:hypothetical protein